MGKYKKYKNRIEMFLSSDMGKRLLNFCYSWGASIVVLGALFKLLHLPFGNEMLFVGMMTEFFVFFISGFEHPGKDYHWEEVFPVLKSKNPMDRPEFANQKVSGIMHSAANEEDDSNANLLINPMAVKQSAGLSGALDISEEDTRNLSDSIKKLSGAAEQISKMAELTDATQQYLDQLAGMADQMKRFSQTTNSLTEVSDTLLSSYKSITDHSDGINQNSRGYVHQMEALNRNISGLNTIYEIQLKSISSQIDTIERINGGLSRIKDLYEGSVVDSSVFRAENERMAQQLAQLNTVYSRLLQAMTVNMPGAGMFQSQSQGGQGYNPPSASTYQPQGAASYGSNPGQPGR